MKKLLILIFSVVITFPALGQRATEILDAVNKKYTSLSAYSCDFKFSGSSSGKGSFLAKGNKYKLSFGGQEIYNNGKDVAIYMPETNEVNISNYNSGDESDFSPNNIFKLYKKGYNATYKQELNVAGKKYDVITLSPKERSSISKIEMNISKTDRLVSSWTVFDKSGKTTYSVSNFKANPKVSDSQFSFDKSKHPNVEVVDLR